jgi:K+-transporting ATPase ATPase A chain
MNMFDVISILIALAAVLVATPVLGRFMFKVFEGERTFLSPILGWLERLIYRGAGVNPSVEMTWRDYLRSVVLFNLIGLVILFLMQVLQSHLPLNPSHLGDVSWQVAFNTAISFVTNTNWQSYGGESTMSYFTQMVGLGVQNFVSAATGFGVMLAVIRGFVRKEAVGLGNFWADLTRSVVYVLIPLSIVMSVVLVSQGVIQNFDSEVVATTMEGPTQKLPQGPAASQIAIKQLGTNGGGFFNANSAHPYENPTPISNFLELIALLLIPAATTYTFGMMVKNRRQGWVLFLAMSIITVGLLAVSLWSEYSHNPIYGAAQLMEGKETRFGVSGSVLWSIFTTTSSNGSVNAMHSSLTPLTGGIAMLNIMLGEIIFGGVGSGLYGILLHVILAVFIAGLMVGRTPEYLGKKIEAFEVKMTMLGVLIPNFLILMGSAVACVLPIGLASLANKGPHGLSEILYAFSSTAGNNGSAFAGLNANTVFYNVTLGLTMLIGRFGVIIPVMAIAGSLARKKITAVSGGTLRTDDALFVFLLISIIGIVGALTFFPALALGPIVEHFLLHMGRTF